MICVGAPLGFKMVYMLVLSAFPSLGLTKDQPPPRRR